MSEGEEVTFYFIKSPQHQEVLVDGAFGGVTPQGRVAMTVYSERGPVPTAVHHELKNGVLGPELPDTREGKKGYVRIAHSTLYLDYAQAVAVRDWLDQKITELNKLREQKK